MPLLDTERWTRVLPTMWQRDRRTPSRTMTRYGTCPCRKSDPDVLVVETTENWPRKNPANGMNYT